MFREILILILIFYYLEMKGCFGDSICFHNLGCFSNDPPFNNTEGAVPLDPSFIQTTFLLYTRQNRHIGQNLDMSNTTSITASHFDRNMPTKIIIHGFEQNGHVDWVIKLMTKIFHKEAANIIAVDWGRGAGFPYIQAAANTRVVAAEIAAFMSVLKSISGTSYSQYHLIGHSLGAHVAGYTGQRIEGLSRITGLDPAEPNFKGMPTEVRLDASDALFVDVIHTDGTEFNEFSGYGMLDPLGHVDFYPNGGVNQPGCSRDHWIGLIRNAYDDGIIKATENTLACSHSRSIRLYIESVNSPCSFTAFPCDNYQDFQDGRCLQCPGGPCPSMGYGVDTSVSGSYYLSTTASPPYCGYMYHVTVRFGYSMRPSRGTLKIRLLGSHGLSDYFNMESRNAWFQRNGTNAAMFISRLNLGRLLQVQITFQAANGWFSWGDRKTISVGMVSVNYVESGEPLHFCGHDHVVGDSIVGFSQTSSTQAGCSVNIV